MKYDPLIEDLGRTALYMRDKTYLRTAEVLEEAAKAIKELQSTVVIVEVKENNDE